MDLMLWLLWMISFFVFGLFHELGHILMSRIFFNDRDWVIEMGSGATIFSSRRLVINAWFFMPGKAVYSVHTGKKYQHILRAAGGFTVNVLFIALVFIFAILFTVRERSMWWSNITVLIMLVNVAFVVMTAIPIKYPSIFGAVSGMPSDGLTILRLIRSKSNSPS